MIRIAGATLGFVALFAFALPAVANAQAIPENELIVTKIVEGPVPAGTEFQVEVDCTFIPLSTEAGAGPELLPIFPVTLTFGEDGGSEPVDVPFFTDQCTATETDDGGASSVVYGGEDNGCDITATQTDVTADYPGLIRSEDGGEPSGPGLPALSCEVTITNTFEAEPEPEPEPAPAAAVVVQITPTFTG